jgi:hypothetical protein
VADSNTKESSSVTKDGGIDALPKTSSPPPGLVIEDIEGVGPTTARKLKETGIVSVMDSVVTSADELGVDINTSKESAAAFIRHPKGFLETLILLKKNFLLQTLLLKKEVQYLDLLPGLGHWMNFCSVG